MLEIVEQVLRTKRIILLREESQGKAWKEGLQSLGYEVVLYPLLQFVPRATLVSPSLKQAHIVIFTSSNAITFFFQQLKREGGSSLSFESKKIYCIGKATASALEKEGITHYQIAKKACQEGITELLPSDLSGHYILFPSAAETRNSLETTLSKRGAFFEKLILYDTVIKKDLPPFSLQPDDFVFFTSPSTVRFFFQSPLASSKTYIPCFIGESTQKEFLQYSKLR